MPGNLENSAVTTGLEKVSHIAGGFFTNIYVVYLSFLIVDVLEQYFFGLNH